jgi:hypothetical protein
MASRIFKGLTRTVLGSPAKTDASRLSETMGLKFSKANWSIVSGKAKACCTMREMAFFGLEIGNTPRKKVTGSYLITKDSSSTKDGSRTTCKVFSCKKNISYHGPGIEFYGESHFRKFKGEWDCGQKNGIFFEYTPQGKLVRKSHWEHNEWIMEVL